MSTTKNTVLEAKQVPTCTTKPEVRPCWPGEPKVKDTDRRLVFGQVDAAAKVTNEASTAEDGLQAADKKWRCRRGRRQDR